MTKRATLWLGWALMLVGVAAAIIVLALPVPGSSPAVGYMPPPRWHDTVIGIGFGVTCLGAAVLIFTQLKRWDTSQ